MSEQTQIDIIAICTILSPIFSLIVAIWNSRRTSRKDIRQDAITMADIKKDIESLRRELMTLNDQMSDIPNRVGILEAKSDYRDKRLDALEREKA